MYNNRSEAYYLSGIEERVAYANNLWSKLTAYDNFNRMSSVFVTSINLLNNALMCFEYGLYLSSVLTCRVVIESALYTATSNEDMKVIRPPPAAIGSHEYIGSYNSTKRAHLLIDLSFGGLKNEAQEQRLVSKKTYKLIDSLQEKGNIAAHYAQKQAKYHQRFIPKRAAEVGIEKAIEEVGERCIFDPDETKKTLETTVTVLIDIMDGTNSIKVVKD